MIKKFGVRKIIRSMLFETIRRLIDSKTTYQAKNYKKSVHCVYQVWNKYINKEESPEVGKVLGRPTCTLDLQNLSQSKN